MASLWFDGRSKAVIWDTNRQNITSWYTWYNYISSRGCAARIEGATGYEEPLSKLGLECETVMGSGTSSEVHCTPGAIRGSGNRSQLLDVLPAASDFRG